jgi:hypothetical protein
MKWNKIVDEFGAEYSVVANDGSKFYIQTNANGASTDKIVLYDVEQPEKVREVLFLSTNLASLNPITNISTPFPRRASWIISLLIQRHASSTFIPQTGTRLS